MGKESIFAELEESIFLEKVSVDVGEEKESCAVVVVVVVWETSAAGVEEQEKGSAVFWLVVVMDFSSAYYEERTLSDVSVVMGMHSGRLNVFAFFPLLHFSHLISSVARLLRRRRSQSQKRTAGFVSGIVASVARNQLLPFCHLYLPIQITRLSGVLVLVKVTPFSRYLYVLLLYLRFSLEKQSHDFFSYDLTAVVLVTDGLLAVGLLEGMVDVFVVEDLKMERVYEFF